jgi:hypothetical protein
MLQISFVIARKRPDEYIRAKNTAPAIAAKVAAFPVHIASIVPLLAHDSTQDNYLQQYARLDASRQPIPYSVEAQASAAAFINEGYAVHSMHAAAKQLVLDVKSVRIGTRHIRSAVDDYHPARIRGCLACSAGRALRGRKNDLSHSRQSSAQGRCDQNRLID